MKKFEQLNQNQRVQLSVLLKEKSSLSAIAKEMNVSRQTLYREILRNSFINKHDVQGRRSSCIHYLECRKNTPTRGNSKSICPVYCDKYEPGKQDCLKKYPFVCNYCSKKLKCNYLHVTYEPEHASNEYHNRINNANAFPKVDAKVMKKVNKLVSPLVSKGQSVEAIKMNHPDLPVSTLTIRNWIKNHYLDCKPSEFRMSGRRVSKKYDYSTKNGHIKLNEAKLGHKYANYRLFKSAHPESLTIQLDSVIGTIDGKHTVLTIHVVEHKLQFGILLNSHSAEEVKDKLNELLSKMLDLQKSQGYAIYTFFTECWLTDNGAEFDRLLDLNKTHKGLNIFFCSPYSSFEKGACERNHVLVRYIQYKGWSFDNLCQKDINILFSNINSYPRKSLKGKTPYQSVLEDSRLGKEFLDLIEINKVECDDVTLNPSLLRKIKN